MRREDKRVRDFYRKLKALNDTFRRIEKEVKHQRERVAK
jgi:hypothetical protein